MLGYMQFNPGVAQVSYFELTRYIPVYVGARGQKIRHYCNFLRPQLYTVINTCTNIRLSKLKKCRNHRFEVTGAMFFNPGGKVTYLLISDFFATSMSN